MISDQQEVYNAFEALYNIEFMALVKERITIARHLQSEFMRYNTLYLKQLKKKDQHSQRDLLIYHKTYLENCVSFNKTNYPYNDQSYSRKGLTSFVEGCQNLLNEISPVVIENEEEIHRAAYPTDGKSARLRKWMKRVRFRVSSLFYRKPKQPVFKRKVPLRNYVSMRMYVDAIANCWRLYAKVMGKESIMLDNYKIKCKEIEALFTIDAPVDVIRLIAEIEAFNAIIEKFVNDFDAYEKGLERELKQVFDDAKLNVEKDYINLGTFQGRTYRNRNWYVERKRKARLKELDGKLTSWETSLYSISEDWAFDTELFLVKNSSMLAQLHLTEGACLKRINKVSDWIISTKEKARAESSSLIAAINAARDCAPMIHSTQKKIATLLESSGSSLSAVSENETIPFALNALQEQVLAEVVGITDKHMLLKEDVPFNEMRIKHLAPVYLKELLQFEILPRFEVALDKAKQASTKAIIAYENSLHNLVHVSDYNHDTARLVVEDEIEVDGKEKAKAILAEGEQQVSLKLDQINQKVRDIFVKVDQDAEQAILRLHQDLVELTDIENVGDLKVRLLRAKALNRGELLKKQALIYWRIANRHLNKIWLLARLKGSSVSQQLTKIYGSGDPQAQINNDISNFLAETISSIESMPFLYQRLFRLEPIDEGYLFFERTEAMNMLRNAYGNWKKGRFSTLAVVAEKGAGITSTLRYFAKETEEPKTFINYLEETQVYRPEEFLKALSASLGAPENSDKDELIEFLLHGEKRVVVLEGLQFIYLKKVDGFDSLKLFFEISSKTNKNVFWVSSCTQHAWNYLKKSIVIDDYFGYSVQLGEFSKDEMVEIVLKRHKVSGYDLKFLPGDEDLASRKYRRLSEEAQQDYLQKSYFLQLNNLAKGNLSVAFIFWLRSVGKIENNVLEVNSMSGFDSKFIQGMSQEKLFCLYALLIHDGLDLPEFCKVMRYTPNAGRMKLIQMVDDGLIILHHKRYVINLLLYRPTIYALSGRNLIH